MDKRINKTKVKLTQIPEVYSKSYKNILKRVVYARSLQEIGDVETLNQTQLGKLKEQGFKFEIINEAIKDSRMDLDINSGLDKLINYSSLIKSLSENLKVNKVNRKDVSELEMTINKLNTAFENFNKRAPIYLESKTDFESYLENINNAKVRHYPDGLTSNLQDLYNSFNNGFITKIECINKMNELVKRNGRFENTLNSLKDIKEPIKYLKAIDKLHEI